VALTGLQEIQKMIQHFRRVHLAELTMNEALELREKWEKEQDAEESEKKQ
jgi:hypothetical protein